MEFYLILISILRRFPPGKLVPFPLVVPSYIRQRGRGGGVIFPPRLLLLGRASSAIFFNLLSSSPLNIVMQKKKKYEDNVSSPMSLMPRG